MDQALNLTDLQEDIEILKKIVLHCKAWKIILKGNGKVIETVRQNKNYKIADICLKHMAKCMKDRRVIYDHLIYFQEQGQRNDLLDLLQIQTNESLRPVWEDNQKTFNQYLHEVTVIESVLSGVYKNVPQDNLPPGFMKRRESTEMFMAQIKQLHFARDLKSKAAEIGITELMASCKFLKEVVHSQVFWNVGLSKILWEFIANTPKDITDDVLESVHTLFREESDEEILNVPEDDQVNQFLDIVLETGGNTFREQWERLMTDIQFPMSACVIMFKNASFNLEIEVAEKYLVRNIKHEVKSALLRLENFNSLEKSVDAMKVFIKSCKIEDSEFLIAIEPFELLLSEDCSDLSFTQVSRSLETVFRIAGPLIEDTIAILQSIGDASNLVDFLFTIADEDIRNLIDAVEDISEQHVQENSVASLIEVKRFLQPLLKTNSNDDAKSMFEVVNKQVKMNLNQARTIPAKIEDCMNNLHNLKSLYNNVANRSELTKEIILNIVRNGKFHFILCDKGTDCEFKASYGNKKTKIYHSKSVLTDLRSRALLLTNKQESKAGIEMSEVGQESNTGIGLSELESFVHYIDSCSEISDLVVTLHATGHMRYKTFTKIQDASCLESLKQDLEVELCDWCKQLKLIRDRYYLFNFLQGFQIHILHSFLVSIVKSNDRMTDEAQAVLRNIHPDFQLPKFEGQFIHIKDKQSLVDNFSFLDCIGKALHECFKNVKPIKRCLKSDLNNEKKLRDVVQKRRLLVAHLDESSLLVVRTVLTLFYNTVQALPEPNQVLFCTRLTSWSEIELLLRRCLGASEFYGTDALYCLANVEVLPNKIQFKLVEALRNLDSKQSYLFAVVCRGSKNHPLIDELSNFVCKVRPLSDKIIEEILQRECPNVTTVTSEVAGLGKTTHIVKQAYSSGKSLTTLHISGQMTKENIVNQLRSMKIRQYNTLHIDVGCLANPMELDTFLFELIVLCYVTTGKTSVYLPSPFVSIEIANSLHDELRTSLQTAILFQREHISWQNYHNFIVSKEINSPIQVVSHFLLQLGKKNLDTLDIVFNGTKSVIPLSSSKCQELLRQYFPTFPGISFSIVNIFLNVLADQLKKMSGSTFFKIFRIKDMLGHKTVPTIRSCLVQALVDVSREFAHRSVDACRTTQISTLDVSFRFQGDHVSTKAEDVAKRVEGMIRWEDSNHLMYVFHNQNIQTVSPIYRDRTKVPEHIKTLFESQMNKEMQDYEKMSQSELQTILQKICRSDPQMLPQTELSIMSKEYALTPDNLLKMILIVLRIKAAIPVLIMGETGCGKTSLIRYLAKICGVEFDVLNIHAGVEEGKIIGKVMKCNIRALQNMDKQLWLFLDEINTSEHVGLISDVICHSNISSKKLAPNLTVMGACNPYKLRSQKAITTAGLKGKVNSDELSKLVYRVLPLPEMLVDFVWDFGCLKENDERLYILRMTDGLFNRNSEHKVFAELLSKSQSFLRTHEDSSCSVSLRDVHRCKILTQWFIDILKRKPVNNKDFIRHVSADVTIKAMTLALAHCYHCRIPDVALRKEYRETIAKVFQENDTYLSESNIDDIIKEEQQDILDRMELPLGTAKNAALRENVFVLLVCILNRIPIFLVGKPGCSKSLSMQVIRSNLRGGDSKDVFFKTLPQLYCVSFQGSESSTSDGIIKVFEKAETYQKANQVDSVRSVVILDEIGLAEISRFNPLKVLHNLLEPDGRDRPNVAVVGISNWSLDASKMNRAIHLSRPEMDEDELFETGISISKSFEQRKAPHRRPGIDFSSSDMKPEFRTEFIRDDLLKIAKSYFKYTKKIAFQNFHGLRDFYSLVKYFAKESSKKQDLSDKVEIIRIGLERNFGGLPTEKHTLLSEFHFAETEINRSVVSLIEGNVQDPTARHLMLITTGESVLGILEKNLDDIGRKNREVIFGSQFEEDLTDDYNYRILNKIILCMEQGLVLILKNLESIYGSLYDMLNQNYTVIGKKKNCRVALGPYSNPICHVADSFRCIVLVDDNKLQYSDPPFLNRFEKQYLRFSDIIKPEQKDLIQKLETWVQNLSVCESFDEYDAFPIYSEDMVSSLVLQNYKPDFPEYKIFEKCKLDLLWILRPEVMVRVARKKCHGVSHEADSLMDRFMLLPIHTGMNGLVENQLSQERKGIKMHDCLMNIVFTNSNIHTNMLQNSFEFEVQVEKLGAFKSEKQLASRVQSFWLESNASILFVQCSAVDDAKHIMLAKSVIEKFRQEFLSLANNSNLKHVYMIVHEDRSKGKSHILQHINFLSPWALISLDSLVKPAVTFPELHTMTLYDVLLTKRPLNDYIREQLFMAFTRLKYSQGGRNVESLSKLMTKIQTSDSFLHMLDSLIMTSIEKHFPDIDDKDWQVRVASSKQFLKAACSFTEALEGYILQIINVPLIKYLFVTENGNMIDTYFVDDEYTGERREIWESIILNEEQFSITKIPDHSGPESYTCSSSTIELKMPFSKFIYETIETLSEDFLYKVGIIKSKCGLDPEDDLPNEIFLELQKEQTQVISQVLPRLSHYSYSSAVEDYTEDFCGLLSMQIFPGPSTCETVQYAKKMIVKKINLFPKCDLSEVITVLHTTTWIHLPAIRSQMKLFEICRNLCTAEELKVILNIEQFIQTTDKNNELVGRQTSEDSKLESHYDALDSHVQKSDKNSETLLQHTTEGSVCSVQDETDKVYSENKTGFNEKVSSDGLNCEKNALSLDDSISSRDLSIALRYLPRASESDSEFHRSESYVLESQDKIESSPSNRISTSKVNETSEDNYHNVIQNDKEKSVGDIDDLTDEIVQLIGMKMLPTQETVQCLTSINDWSMKVKEVLDLLIQLSPCPKTFHCLHVFSEIVTLLIIPFYSDYSGLYKMADFVQAEDSLDSSTVFEALRQLLQKTPTTSSGISQRILCTYFLSCLLSDPESKAFVYFIDLACTGALPEGNIVSFKQVLSLSLEYEMQETEDILFQILEYGITEPCEAQTEESLHTDDSFEAEKTFLNYLNEAMKRLENCGKSQCPFIVMTVDLIEEIFTQTLFSMESKTDHDPLECLILSHGVMTTGKFDLQYVVAIGFFKACIKFIACDIQLAERNSTDHLDAMLSKEVRHKIMNTLESYIMKIIGLEKRSIAISKTIEKLSETIPNLKDLHQPVTDNFIDSSVDQCPLQVFLTPARENDFQKLHFRNNPKSTESIMQLSMEANVREEGLMMLFAIVEKTFYSPRSYTVLNDNAKSQANTIAKTAREAGFNKHCLTFLLCLLGKEDFAIAHLGQSEQRSSRDCLLSTFLVSVFSLALEEPGKGKLVTIFQNCLLYPDTVNFNDFQDWLWYKREDCDQLMSDKSVQFLTCECMHRIAFSAKDGKVLNCSVCSKHLDMDVRVETMDEQLKYDSENQTKSPLYTVRNLSPVACQILCLLMKSCMIGSLALRCSDLVFYREHLDIHTTDVPERLWEDLQIHWRNIEELLGFGEHSVGIFLHMVLFKLKDMIFNSIHKMQSCQDKNIWEEIFNSRLEDLLSKRFEFQKSMIEHHRALTGETNRLEDILLEVDESSDDEKHTEVCYPFATLFRVKGESSFINFVSELHPVRKDFPILSYIINHRDQMKLLPHIQPIVQWHMAVVSCANYIMKKHVFLRLTVTDFIQQTGDKEKIEILRKRFGQMQKSWSHIRTNFRNKISEEMINMHFDLRMEKCIIYDYECVQYRLLQALAEIQNDVIDHLLAVSFNCPSVNFLMRSEQMSVIPCVKITDVALHHLFSDEDFDWPRTIKENTQNCTSYGQGKRNIYNFRAIEKLLGRTLVTGKAFIIISSLPQIVFTDELYKNYVSLSKEIRIKVKQKPLSPNIRSAVIDRNKNDPRIGRELLLQIGMIMTLLNKTGGDPEKCLIDYVDEIKNILTKKFSDELLPNPTTAVKLSNIIALYEVLEEINSESIKDALEDKFRDELLFEQKIRLETMVKRNGKLSIFVLGACKRFIHRCLSLREADENRPLQEYIDDASFWPEGIYTAGIIRVGEDEEKIVEIIPKQITVKNIYHTVDLIEKLLEVSCV